MTENKLILTNIIKRSAMLCLILFAAALLFCPLRARAAEPVTLDISGGPVTVMAEDKAEQTDQSGIKKNYTFDPAEGLTLTGTSDKHSVTVNRSVTGLNLTLSGLSIDVSGQRDKCAFSIGTGAGVVMTLAGDNRLASSPGKTGLLVEENASLTLRGDGSLSARAEGKGCGIGAAPGLTPGNCENTVTIEGGRVTTETTDGYGILAREVSLQGSAEVSASVVVNKENSVHFGIFGQNLTIGDGSSPTKVGVAADKCNGLGAQDKLTINEGAAVTVELENKAKTCIAVGGNSDLTIGEGTKVSAKGGYFGIYSQGLNITGGQVSAVSAQYGINCNNSPVSISGGTVEARATDAAQNPDSAGIVGHKIDITGGQVTAEGHAYGIYGEFALTITGGSVNASAVSGTGIKVNNINNGVVIKGGSVKAAGQRAAISPQPTNGAGAAVNPVTLTVQASDGSAMASKPVTALSVGGITGVDKPDPNKIDPTKSQYGLHDVRTDSEGRVCVYLPKTAREDNTLAGLILDDQEVFYTGSLQNAAATLTPFTGSLTLTDTRDQSLFIWNDGYGFGRDDTAAAKNKLPYKGNYTLTGDSTVNTVTVMPDYRGLEGDGKALKTITLDGLSIDVSAKSGVSAFDLRSEGLAANPSVSLRLADGTANCLKSGGMAGLHAGHAARVFIEGEGSLEASSTGAGAGIGSNERETEGCVVQIKGGSVTAVSAAGSGIGASHAAISGGRVEARGAVRGIHGIENVTLSGGTIIAEGGSGDDISVTGTNEMNKLYISGGSVKAVHNKISPQPVRPLDGSRYDPVYLNTVKVGSEDQNPEISVEGRLTIDGNKDFGDTGTCTMDNGKLYLYLPANETDTRQIAVETDKDTYSRAYPRAAGQTYTATLLGPPSYKVTIPARVDLGDIAYQPEHAPGQYKDTGFSVTYQNLYNFGDGRTFSLSLIDGKDKDSVSNAFKMTGGGGLTYELYKGLNISAPRLSSQDKIFAKEKDASGKQQEIYLRLDQHQLKRSGQYEGQLLFRVGIEDVVKPD